MAEIAEALFRGNSSIIRRMIVELIQPIVLFNLGRYPRSELSEKHIEKRSCLGSWQNSA
jgi:hypothetical protein